MLTTLDNIVVIIAVIGMIAIAVYFSRTVQDMESYFVCNKSLPWSLTVGTLVATWYGGVGTLGSVEWFALFGLSMWLCWCVTAHLSRMPMALWVGPKMQVRTELTVPELLGKTYGKSVAFIGAILLIVYSSQFGSLTTAGFVGKVAWNAPYLVTGGIVVTIVIAIAVAAGLMGVAVTDMLMFFFLGTAVAMTVPLRWADMGGWEAVQSALIDKPELLDPIGGLTPTQVITFIILGIVVYADPAFYQRFSASDSPASGRRAMLICLLIWVIFDIVLCATGMMVDVIHPDLDPGLGYVTLVLESLPPGVKALFVVALIGSAISVLDSYFLCAATIFAYDIYGKIKNNVSQKEILFVSRLAVVAMGIAGLAIAFRFTVAMDIFYITSSVWAAGGVVPIVGALLYKGKKTPAGGFLSMIGGMASYIYLYNFPIGDMEPLPIAFGLSIVLFAIGNNIGKSIETEEYLEVN